MSLQRKLRFACLKPIAKTQKLQGTTLCQMVVTVRVTGVLADNESVKVGDAWANMDKHENHGDDLEHY
jgi:hypothetical protein